MVAKIFFSTSFLITRLALMPSFSESSLTVMPSETVISRSMGGGAAALLAPRRAFEVDPLPVPDRDDDRARPAWPDAAAAVRWESAWPARRAAAKWDAACCGRRHAPALQAGAADTGTTHDRLAGTNGAAIDRLAGNGRRAASRHARTSCLRLSLARRWTGLLLLQPRHHVGTRRNHRTRRRLSGKIRAWLRAQRGSWSWRSQWRSCFGRRRRGAGDRWTRKCDGRRRHRRRGTGRRWQRLPGTRQDLARARRRKWAGRNGTRAQRRM